VGYGIGLQHGKKLRAIPMIAPYVYYKLKIPENIKKISLVISAGIPWKNQGQLKTASW